MNVHTVTGALHNEGRAMNHPPFSHGGYTLRRACTAHLAGIAALIDNAYNEYGDRAMLRSADADLLDIEQHVAGRGGRFTVVEDHEGNVVASHAVSPLCHENDLCVFKRFYLSPSLHGGVWGDILMDWAILTAKALGFQNVEIWSDGRFAGAHALLRRFGFKHNGDTRSMNDDVMPYRELYFYLRISSAILHSPVIDELRHAIAHTLSLSESQALFHPPEPGLR